MKRKGRLGGPDTDGRVILKLFKKKWDKKNGLHLVDSEYGLVFAVMK